MWSHAFLRRVSVRLVHFSFALLVSSWSSLFLFPGLLGRFSLFLPGWSSRFFATSPWLPAVLCTCSHKTAVNPTNKKHTIADEPYEGWAFLFSLKIFLSIIPGIYTQSWAQLLLTLLNKKCFFVDGVIAWHNTHSRVPKWSGSICRYIMSARNLTTKVTIHRQTRSLSNNILDKKCGASTVHTMIYDDFTKPKLFAQ